MTNCCWFFVSVGRLNGLGAKTDLGDISKSNSDLNSDGEFY